jgi:hypothetical protein
VDARAWWWRRLSPLRGRAATARKERSPAREKNGNVAATLILHPPVLVFASRRLWRHVVPRWVRKRKQAGAGERRS